MKGYFSLETFEQPLGHTEKNIWVEAIGDLLLDFLEAKEHWEGVEEAELYWDEVEEEEEKEKEEEEEKE